MSFEADFFRALQFAEDVHYAEVGGYHFEPKYAEGYDYVMDDVKDVIASGDVEDLRALDEFINRLDAFAEDNELGNYADGYQDAVNVCLEAVSELFETAAV